MFMSDAWNPCTVGVYSELRAGRHLLWAVVMLGAAVGIGTYGYHATARLGWLDAFLNASMILSGMGPVDRLESSTAKVFASLDALFSGLMFLGIAGVVEQYVVEA